MGSLREQHEDLTLTPLAGEHYERAAPVCALFMVHANKKKSRSIAPPRLLCMSARPHLRRPALPPPPPNLVLDRCPTLRENEDKT